MNFIIARYQGPTMRICANACLGAMLILATPVLAQSTATIVPEASAAGITPPEPATPLDVPDADYPLLSIIAGETGRVEVNLIVNAEGKVSVARVLTPSGHPRLEQQAAAIARSRWLFTPGTRDGKSTAASVNIAVTWKLPGERVRVFDIAVPQAPEGAMLPGLAFDAPVATDYPADALKNQDQGIVGLRYLLQANGTVGEVQIAETSGHKTLDDAAATFLKRQTRLKPALVNGAPREMWHSFVVFYGLAPDVQDKAKMRCFERPIAAENGETIIGTGIQTYMTVAVPITSARQLLQQSLTNKDLKGAIRGPTKTMPAAMNPDDLSDLWVQRWMHIGKDGTVNDVLVGTAIGFLRPTASVMAPMMQASGYEPPPTEAGCWYFDPIRIPKGRS